METKSQSQVQPQVAPQLQVINDKAITEQVLRRIESFQAEGAMHLPPNYSAANALKSAFLILKETTDRNKQPVLTACTHESIGSALLDMAVTGLNPMKKQCYFIAYGNKLTLIRSYMGNMALAKRAGMKSIVAQVVYEGDKYMTRIEPETGLKKLVSHESNVVNQMMDKIVAAYAIVTLNDGTSYLEDMNISQIKMSWTKSITKGDGSVHKEYADQMAKRTIINRACKLIINASDDAYLFDRGVDESENVDEIEKSIDVDYKEVSDFNPEQKTIEVSNEPKAEPF